MIAAAYAGLWFVTIAVLYRHFRGRTVEQLFRNPPSGSDLNAIVTTLSYLEHELIKHRVPVIRSLLAKKTWNAADWQLLNRVLGHGETAIQTELKQYFGDVQTGAGRTRVNFNRDRPFRLAAQHVSTVQANGDRWLRGSHGSGPNPGDRAAVDEACEWLAGPFRRYLVELERSVLRCSVTKVRLERSSRRGLAEAATDTELTTDEPPEDCVVRSLGADFDLVIRNLVRNAAQAEVPGGGPQRVHIDVQEQLEPTGEENVLVRIHDASPVMLTSEMIYGRESKRGLGLVTRALARNGGAVRCLPSDRDGFEKLLEVRLSRSLHEPDLDAQSIARPRRWTLALPVIATVTQIAAIAVLLALMGSGDGESDAFERGIAAIESGIVNPRQRCTSLSEALDLAETVEKPAAGLLLVAQGRLWSEGTDAGDGARLRLLDAGEEGAQAQQARFYLSLLSGEGLADVSSAEASGLIRRLQAAYMRPPMDAQPDALLLELIGARHFVGERLRVAVPELICALADRYPDLVVGGPVCSDRPVDQRVTRYLEAASEYLGDPGPTPPCSPESSRI
jgi:hypothetical protein